MSEPDGAFLRLEIGRGALVAWLDAPTPPPARWTDWDALGGAWYLAGEPRPLRDTPAALASVVAAVGARLAGATNRAMLADMFRPAGPYGAESANTRHIEYDAAARLFTAGALIYAEGLENLIAFLAVARGAADALGPAGSGVAAVHGWAFDGATAAAVRLGPGGTSRFLAGGEAAEAARQFEPVADRFLAGGERAPEPVDHLDALWAGPADPG